MTTVRSFLGLAAALFSVCAGPAAAENVLRFISKDATAVTMDPDSEEVLRNIFSQNELNLVGYANPRVDELMVTYARDAYLEEAWRIVTNDLVYLPIRHEV